MPLYQDISQFLQIHLTTIEENSNSKRMNEIILPRKKLNYFARVRYVATNRRKRSDVPFAFNP